MPHAQFDTEIKPLPTFSVLSVITLSDTESQHLDVGLPAASSSRNGALQASLHVQRLARTPGGVKCPQVQQGGMQAGYL